MEMQMVPTPSKNLFYRDKYGVLFSRAAIEEAFYIATGVTHDENPKRFMRFLEDIWGHSIVSAEVIESAAE